MNRTAGRMSYNGTCNDLGAGTLIFAHGALDLAQGLSEDVTDLLYASINAENCSL